MERTLYRSRSDRMIAGVCAGIAEYFQVDPTLIRLLSVLAAVVSFGTVAIAYLIMAVAVPEEPERALPQQVAGTPTDLVAVAPALDSTAPASPVTQGIGSAAGSPPAVPAEPPEPIPAAPAAAAVAPARAEHEGRPHRRGGSSAIFGAILLVAGIFLLAGQFIPGFDVWRLWPLLIVAIGLIIIVRGGRR